jgi:oxygen-independent coproporphyrinogen-3 oxidase
MNEINSLYIHFPFCVKLCNYCDFYKHVLESSSQLKDFEELFLSQWKANEVFLAENNRAIGELETLYFGGGTPSLWRSRGAKFINDFFEYKNIKFKNNYEFTLEVDPGTCSEEDIDAWISIGVNRFSVGVQGYDEKLLSLMDRSHGIGDIDKLLTILKKRNVNFSVDLMIGLPHEETRNIKHEIISLNSFNPSHFSVYILKARKNYPHFDKLPNDEKVRSEYLEVHDVLKSIGYDQYEVSNFALSGKESRHNRKYWDYAEVCAIGSNATGLLVNDDSSVRYQWKSSSAGFQVEEITGSSLIMEKLFLGMRNSKGVNLFELLEIEEDHQELVQLYRRWESLGYLASSSKVEHIVLGVEGYLMCDSLIDDIFKIIDF